MSVELDPQLRICISCDQRLYSAVHCSDEEARCPSCGMPMLETFASLVFAIRGNYPTAYLNLTARRRYG